MNDVLRGFVEAPLWATYTDRQRWGYLVALFLVSTSSYFDRQVISVLLEPIKNEFHVSDTMLGMLGGFCFAVFYAIAGMPIARWADRGNRRTIITAALTMWSVMTVLCGLAQTFWQLALARVGVGAGEAGAIPASHSLIADYFPPERRATALAAFTSASTAGLLLGVGFGGYIAAMHGWRSAFLVAGAPGFVLALIARFCLAEPRLRPHSIAVTREVESVYDSISRLRRKRSYLYGLVGCLVYFLFAYGVFIFIPSFLTRVMRVSPTQASVTYAMVAAAGSVVGMLGGGWLADRLGRRDTRWLAWLPAAALTLSVPIFAAALWVDQFSVFLVLVFAVWALVNGGLPPVFAAIHVVCGHQRRATAIAVVLFSATLIGGGLGPVITGALSDSLGIVHGVEGLRYSLMLMTSLLLVAGALFYRFGRMMPADIED